MKFEKGEPKLKTGYKQLLCLKPILWLGHGSWVMGGARPQCVFACTAYVTFPWSSEPLVRARHLTMVGGTLCDISQ